MKTNNMIAKGLAASAIIALSLTSTFAMGQGAGQGSGNGSGQGMHQGLGNGGESVKGNGGENMQGDNANMISNIEKQDLDATEIDLLMKQYEEEMMANELYSSFYEMYGDQTFNNIANSEAQHMDAVKTLLDRYELDIPTNYDHIQSLYEELKAKGSLSLKDALEVGISIEKVDIDDIITAIKASDNEDIRVVLTNIGGASYNHMRGFVKALENNNLTTDIDYSDYLTSDLVNTKGPIKYLLAEKLESEGVDLPENVNSQNIKTNSEKERFNEMRDGRGNPELQSKRNEYKNTYSEKYSNTFNIAGEDKLNTIIGKIDTLVEQIINGDYSQEFKEKLMPMLLGLKDSILEKINN